MNMRKDRSLQGNADSATIKANEILLALQSPVGCKLIWILVEGADDCKIYSKFFEYDKARVDFTNGGKNVRRRFLLLAGRFFG